MRICRASICALEDRLLGMDPSLGEDKVFDFSLGLMRAINQLRYDIARVDERMAMMQIEYGMLAMQLASPSPSSQLFISARECERNAKLAILRAKMATDACILSNMRADHDILMELMAEDSVMSARTNNQDGQKNDGSVEIGARQFRIRIIYTPRSIAMKPRLTV